MVHDQSRTALLTVLAMIAFAANSLLCRMALDTTTIDIDGADLAARHLRNIEAAVRAAADAVRAEQPARGRQTFQ